MDTAPGNELTGKIIVHLLNFNTPVQKDRIGRRRR